MKIKSKNKNNKNINRKTLTKRQINIKLKKLKKEKSLYYKYFNLIKGYIPSLNIIINDLDDYILIVQVLSFKSLKIIIENMQKLKIKELQIFNHKGYHFLSLKFKVDKNKKGKINFQYITKFIKDFEWRKDEFKILRITEILMLLKEKVYRQNEINYKFDDKINKDVIYIDDKKLRDVVINKEHSYLEFQNNIMAKKVKIDNDLIIFNEENDIKNQVLGLQMYPSILYKGYLSELNHIQNVETCTYIKTIDAKKCIENLDKKNNISFQENNLRNYIKENYDNKINMYNTTFFIHIYGNDEEIKKTKEIVSKISFKYHVILNDFVKQQSRGFTSFLPLMNNRIKCYRAITDYEGILPFNENVIKNFKNGFYFGKELISGNDFYYNRFNNGVIISSNNAIKNYYMEREMLDIFNKYNKSIYKINFKELSRLKNVNLRKVFREKNLNEALTEFNIDEEKLYILFKIYVYLCLSRYKENIKIDINDKEILDGVFEKLENKILEDNENVSIDNKINRIFNYLNKNYNKLYIKIIKQYNDPNHEIEHLMKGIFDIFVHAKPFKNEFKKYIYVYECQEIVDVLDIIFRYIFNNTFENTFLFSSSNDFLLLNNKYVSKEMFKSKYINMLDISNNDCAKIKKYLNLPNDDIVHLNNKAKITGILYTNLCEFNYYIERKEINNNI